MDSNTHVELPSTVEGITVTAPVAKEGETVSQNMSELAAAEVVVVAAPADETSNPLNDTAAMPPLVPMAVQGQIDANIQFTSVDGAATSTHAVTAPGTSTMFTPMPNLPEQAYKTGGLSSRKQQSRMDNIWYRHLDELKEYKAKNGHCSVPRKSGQLGEWCRTQRRYYKQYRKGQSVPLTRERMKALESLGFIWLPAEERRKKKRQMELIKQGVQIPSESAGLKSDGDADMQDALATQTNEEHVITFKTPELEEVHKQYGDTMNSFYRANETLYDAQRALEKAQQALKEATEKQKVAYVAMDKVCEEVLEKELTQNDDDWNKFYVELVAYKEKHGDISFAKPACSDDKGKKDEEDEGDEDEEMKEGESEEKTEDPDVAAAEAVVNEISADATEEPKTLEEWVHAIRRAPKKSLGEWKCRALDKLGFIWNEYDAIWTARYNSLVEYAKENGNARVPCNHKTLGVWVGTQRKQFKLKQKGKKSHLTDEREELLNKIDFVWDVNVWSERFAELAAFKQQFGHFSVPVEFPNKQLRPWISTQRSQYRFKQEKKPSQLTDRRIELLNSIGFPWKTKEDWQTRFNEALLYYHENGDLNIGRNDEKFPKLYRWLVCQRMEWQKFCDGSKHRLKPEQVKLLKSIGFTEDRSV